MSLYNYKAVAPDGRTVLGRIDALNIVDLELRLRRMELDLIDGEPVDLAWERFDSEDSASLERRVRAFARLPQGRSRRPAWAQTGSGGGLLTETEEAQVIYLLRESGTLCRYVRERSGSGGGPDGLAG